MEQCPICNKQFYHGYYHSARWKLFCHMSSKGKGHKKRRYDMSFPDNYYTIPIQCSSLYVIK